MAFCCWAGKLPRNQICCLTNLSPDKIYSRSIGNNKAVAIIYFSGPKYPDFTSFPFTCTTGTTSCTTSSCRHPRHLLLRPPPPSRSPNRKTSFFGVCVCVYLCHGNIRVLLRKSSCREFAMWEVFPNKHGIQQGALQKMTVLNLMGFRD